MANKTGLLEAARALKAGEITEEEVWDYAGEHGEAGGFGVPSPTQFGSSALDSALNPGREGQEAAEASAQAGADLWQSLEAPGAEELAYAFDEIQEGKGDRAAGRRRVLEKELVTPELMGAADYERDLTGQALTGQGTDYYEDVLAGDGYDAVAEADFARRRSQAQNTRQANTERVMRDMELRGLGGGGAEALGALSAGQSQATAEYLGGLESNAMRQANRDTASGALAQAGESRQAADDAWLWDTVSDQYNRDEYNLNRGMEADILNAGKQTAAQDANTGRGWQVDDANTRWGQTVGGQRITGTQGAFDNRMGAVSGESNALLGLGATQAANAADDRNLFSTGLDAAANFASGAYSNPFSSDDDKKKK